MSGREDPKMERLSRVMGVRRRQFAMRIVIASVVAGLFFGFTGWVFATFWFALYVALQVIELRFFGRDGDQVTTRPQYRLALVLIGTNSFLFGLFGLQEAMVGGPWGVVVGALLWAGAMTNSVVTSIGSRDAFIAAAAPSAVFYLLAPFFTVAAGTSWIYAAAVIVAGGLNTMTGGTIWGAAQRLFDAESEARAEVERKRAEAEAATAAKSAFVAMVSHELRTPISAILAGAADIEKNVADGAARSNAALIHDSGRMMRTLLNDLLDLSKIEAGRMSVETLDYDLRALVLDTIRFWSVEMAKKGLKLRLEGAGGLPRWVQGDPTRLRQILNNLFSNAIKFTAVGSITLKLEAAEADEGGHAIRFEVIDTGPGMNAEQLSRLFMAFEQLSTSTARTHGGTGLGLAISRELAHLMGGELSATSAEGQGATFSLLLPFAIGATPAANEDACDDDLIGETDVRVLIADDHEFNRRAFTLMLEAACADIAAVADGREALDALSTGVFDVVLMDVNMPGMGGLEAVRLLRAGDGPNRNVPVIALTAAGSPEDIAACMAAGMNAFVTKPVEAAELFAAIEGVLTTAAEPEQIALSA